MAQGYLTHRFRDAAGDVRESMSTLAGDYAIFSAGQNHSWEAISDVQALWVRVPDAPAPDPPQFATGSASSHEGAVWAGQGSLEPPGSPTGFSWW